MSGSCTCDSAVRGDLSGEIELAQAVPATGILVCNGDNPGARRMAAEFPKKRAPCSMG
ncbi:MAG: hypothetical protein R3F37_06465 [Candidatus Competibacteraceae bacterium]